MAICTFVAVDRVPVQLQPSSHLNLEETAAASGNSDWYLHMGVVLDVHSQQFGEHLARTSRALVETSLIRVSVELSVITETNLWTVMVPI
jgi:hypothetical protein